MVNGVKKVSLNDFLTEEQIEAAASCTSVNDICETVIRPNIAIINEKLGQKNDPMFLAYCCQYVFQQLGIWR